VWRRGAYFFLRRPTESEGGKKKKAPTGEDPRKIKREYSGQCSAECLEEGKKAFHRIEEKKRRVDYTNLIQRAFRARRQNQSSLFYIVARKEGKRGKSREGSSAEVLFEGLHAALLQMPDRGENGCAAPVGKKGNFKEKKRGKRENDCPAIGRERQSQDDEGNETDGRVARVFFGGHDTKRGRSGLLKKEKRTNSRCRVKKRGEFFRSLP